MKKRILKKMHKKPYFSRMKNPRVRIMGEGVALGYGWAKINGVLTKVTEVTEF